MNLPEGFKKYWEEHNFCKPGATVLVAVSGGVDSMVLAQLMLDSKVSFAIAHCNFKLRGGDADGDQQFVKEWCLVNGVTFHTTAFETKRFSEEWKKGTQETARILRYEWFEELRQEHKYACIATAHHANDSVETLLINLFKGTGIAGIHGILPKQNNVIRPMLFATKAEITEYAYANDIRYREDVSNASDDYLRNAVRHNIVPAVEQWFPNAVNNVSESIGRFRETEQIYRKAVDRELKQLQEQRGQDVYIPVRKLVNRTPLNTICYELIHPYGFTSAQVQQVLHLLGAESGHYVASPTHRIIKNRDFLVITTVPAETTDLVLIEGAPCTVDCGSVHYNFSIQDKPAQLSQDAGVAYIDMAKITFPLILRKWNTGDYLYPLGMNMKKKKVSKLLIDAKMPLHEKEHVWVLECDKRIAWLAGMRLDERFKVREHTDKVLVVTRKVK
jgi:tRNA(Ile)-lysidine synthase